MKASWRWLAIGLMGVLASCGNPSLPSASGNPTTAVIDRSPAKAMTPTALVATVQPSQPSATPESSPPVPTSGPSFTAAPPTLTADVSTAVAASDTPTPGKIDGPLPPISDGTPTTEARNEDSPLAGKLLFQQGADVFVLRLATGEQSLVLKAAQHARWSPDGSKIAFVRADQLLLANDNGSAEQTLVAQSGITSVQWAPDGTRLVFTRQLETSISPEIWVAELATNTAQKIADGSDPAWAPDSKRLAYVTPSNAQYRTQLRLVNWQGQNGWAPVQQVPANAPPLGIPDEPRQPADFEHRLQTPIWDAAGSFIYYPALVGMQVETDFGMWERADARNGGSVFVNELVNVFGAVAAPNREAALLIHSTARGDTYLNGQIITGKAEDYAWLQTEPGSRDLAPAWAPDSQAFAYYHCGLEPGVSCDLVIRTPGGPRTAVANVFTEDQTFATTPPLDWTADRP